MPAGHEQRAEDTLTGVPVKWIWLNSKSVQCICEHEIFQKQYCMGHHSVRMTSKIPDSECL